jgi:hypothetical protein
MSNNPKLGGPNADVLDRIAAMLDRSDMLRPTGVIAKPGAPIVATDGDEVVLVDQREFLDHAKEQGVEPIRLDALTVGKRRGPNI